VRFEDLGRKGPKKGGEKRKQLQEEIRQLGLSPSLPHSEARRGRKRKRPSGGGRARVSDTGSSEKKTFLAGEVAEMISP